MSRPLQHQHSAPGGLWLDLVCLIRAHAVQIVMQLLELTRVDRADNSRLAQPVKQAHDARERGERTIQDDQGVLAARMWLEGPARQLTGVDIRLEQHPAWLGLTDALAKRELPAKHPNTAAQHGAGA